MGGLPDGGRWLDIGCGNGTLAEEWVRRKRSGVYVGIDASRELIALAKEKVSLLPLREGLNVDFLCLDVSEPDWTQSLPEGTWDGVLMFAALHHIPGKEQRQILCRQIRQILHKGSPLFLSVWQVRNSPRLVQRILPWSMAGNEESDVEFGDVLMDWRAEADKENQGWGLRYVHIFTQKELIALAENAGFRVVDYFPSDGKEKNLGLYQRWV